jgi:hypothetical protein
LWQLLTPFRKRVEARRTAARRPWRYRPDCELLEDRCLPSVSLAPGGPSAGPVGSPVTWTATASGHGTTPVYQFGVGPAGGVSHVVRDFSPNNSFTWNPMQEGTYNIQVIVEDSYGAPPSDSASASYNVNSRVVGTGAVVGPTSNPLVALYSAPPSPGSTMYVQLSPAGPDPSWSSTAPQPVAPGESTNFLVAGMLPDTTYFMRDVLSDGTTSAPLTFTTGSLPTNLTFPTFSVQQAPSPGSDPTQDMIYHTGATGGPSNNVISLATDLAGNVDWYYDPVANNFVGYGPSLVPGGTILMLGGNQDSLGGEDTLREIDLAGDPLRETDVAAVNAQLAARGQHPILDFNHDAQRLPNGETAVIANTQRTIDVNGTPALYTGNMVIVLDENFQVAWVWDAFNWLDTNRLPTNGEGPGDWLHGNSIGWSPADGDLVFSMRAQDWVIKIAYGNGTGDGHVVWRLGAGGDFTINSTDPSPWFSHQHDVRYINDDTLVLFDDGNTRRLTNPTADSRGQALVLNEQTMQATLVVNADLGNYSFALGSAQVLPSGNLDFTSGFQGSAPNYFGQSIEVSPDGTEDYVLQMSGLEYRSYFISTLYGGANNSYGLLDSGFKNPSQGTGASAYQYDPTGSAWGFGGAAGLAGNGSAITSGNPGAPGGSQVAFLQGTGTISQVVGFLVAGTYQLSLSAAQRGNNGASNEAFQVQVDGTVVATFTPTSTSYATFTTPSFNVTAGSHTITFVGVDPAGANYTALLDQVSILVPASGTATFVASDTLTQGSWVGTYGADGYNAIGGATSYPSYAQVSASGQSSYTWAASTGDVRAPLQSAAATSRVAACWCSSTSFTVDVNVTDGNTHQVALYLLDWDNSLGGRSEQVDVLDATTGKVLDSESAASFQNGDYLVWDVSGHVQFRVTNAGASGNNAVLSGMFFDPTTQVSHVPYNSFPQVVALTATDAIVGSNVTFRTTIGAYSPSYAVGQQLELMADPGDTANGGFLGQHEVWFRSRVANLASYGYYVLMPDGSLHPWTAGHGPNPVYLGAPIAQLGTAAYANPGQLLASAPPPPAVGAVVSGVSTSGGTTTGTLTLTPPASFTGSFQVVVIASDGVGADAGAFTVRVNDATPQLAPIADQAVTNAQPLPDLTLSATDPAGAAVTFGVAIVGRGPAALIGQQLQLVADPGDTAGGGFLGQHEVWFRSRVANLANYGYYVLMPDGSLHPWTAGHGPNPVYLGAPIAQLGTAAYPNPSQLLAWVSLPPPAVNATVSGVSTSGGTTTGTLTLTPPAGFTGSFEVVVTASDGTAADAKTFLVTVSDSTPQLAYIPDQTLPSSSPLTVPLGATGGNNKPVNFSAVAFKYSPVYDTVQALLLSPDPGDTAHGGFLGKGEVWFRSAVANLANYGYFVLMPDGSLHPWTAGHGSSLSNLGAPVAQLGTAAYADPSQLLGSPIPAVTTAVSGVATSGGTTTGSLTLLPPLGSVGTFRVIVMASDGITWDTWSFLVTVL